MPTPKTILFIDDETYFSKYYVEAVQTAGYEVIYRDTAADGLAYIRERCAEIDLVVLDIMMPTPQGVAVTATNDGHDTGIWLLREARELIEELTLPIVVLSNRARASLEELIGEQVKLPTGLVLVTTKTETSAMMLPQIITRMCNKWPR